MRLVVGRVPGRNHCVHRSRWPRECSRRSWARDRRNLRHALDKFIHQDAAAFASRLSL